MVEVARVRLFDKYNPTRSCFVRCCGSYLVGSTWWITRRQFNEAKRKICSPGSYLCFDDDTLLGESVIEVVDDDGRFCGFINTK